MSAMPEPQPLYVLEASEPTFVTFHAAGKGAARDAAVILCPPFGWDEVCSYRSLREWAHRLAQAGYPTVRLSLPSTGDSGGGPHDPDRVGAWVDAVSSSARWLRTRTAVSRVAAVGIGLGGLVSYLAAATGAIDDLVLWGTPARGRAFVRQQRAFSKLEAATFFEGLEPPPPLPAGELEAGGFLLSAETVQQLERLDIERALLPADPARRALLLKRDGLAVDAKLFEQLQRVGTTVTVAPGDGYSSMTSHPQQARPPLGVIARVIDWLDEASSPAPSTLPPGGSAGATAVSVELALGDAAAVRETPISIAQPFGQLSGVLVEPLEPSQHQLCAVFLNAGAVRRIGPSRMWVEAARRWAARGVPTLRLDVEGIGDSDGDETPYSSDGALYVPELVPQVLAALDFLQAREVGEQFVLAGLCAGAYWSFHAALRDPRVCAAMMLNPRALIWDPGLLPSRDLRALLTEPFSLSKIRRLATGARLRSFVRWVLSAPVRWLGRLASREASRTERRVDAALEQLLASGKRALLLFSEHEPVYDELVRSGRAARLRAWPNVSFAHVGVRDHTMRPTWAQKQAHAALDRALERELELVNSSVPAARAR